MLSFSPHTILLSGSLKWGLPGPNLALKDKVAWKVCSINGLTQKEKEEKRSLVFFVFFFKITICDMSTAVTMRCGLVKAITYPATSASSMEKREFIYLF